MTILHTKRRQEKKIENFKVTSEFFEPNDMIPPKIINEEQIEIFRKCADIAKLSNMNHKHGACIVYKGKIISMSCNYSTSFLNNSYSIHAEVACILNIKKLSRNILKECELYILRLSPLENTYKYSKPCEKCSQFINKYNIRKIYYSTNYDYDYLTR